MNNRNISINYDNNFVKNLSTLPELKTIESFSVTHPYRQTMTQQHSDMIARIFPCMSGMKKLSITKVNLENPDTLANAIRNNKTLESLEIGTLGSNGLTSILRAILASPAPVRSLVLPNCVITGRPARNALYNLIRHHKTLRELRITDCTYDKVDRTIKTIKKSLEKNFTLKTFVFDTAHLSTEDKEDFSSLLERNNTLVANKNATAPNPHRLFSLPKLELPVVKNYDCKQTNGCRY